jgi:hypothetical protein
MDFCLIVTTYCSENRHLDSLRYCLAAIAKHYPTTRTYVLDDHSPLDVTQAVPSSDLMTVHLTKYKQAGELNPYLFVLDLEPSHPRYVFLHDSVTLKPGIVESINQNQEIALLWFTKRYLFIDVFSPPNEEILARLTVDKTPARQLLRQHQRSLNPNFVVAFGGMSVFTKSFAEKLVQHTNIQEVAPLFTSRPNRCFFERFLTLAILAIYGDAPIPVLFGDIFQHPKPFYNQDPHTDYQHPAVKTWAGR